MSAKKRLVIANWKMYIKSPERAMQFVRALRRRSRSFSGISVVVAPPLSLIPAVALALKGSSIHVGAQTVSAFVDEKRTGEVSAPMLKHAGAMFVIVGHSERRAMGETDEMIRAQVYRAEAEGMVPVLCVGEEERDPAGGHFTTIAEQLSRALQPFSDKRALKRLVVAYEPVWAIGKAAGDAMKPAEVQEMAIFIRKTLADVLGRPTALRTAIIYGGSVEKENAATLLNEGDIAGFLVGHASVELDTFLPILEICAK